MYSCHSYTSLQAPASEQCAKEFHPFIQQTHLPCAKDGKCLENSKLDKTRQSPSLQGPHTLVGVRLLGGRCIHRSLVSKKWKWKENQACLLWELKLQGFKKNFIYLFLFLVSKGPFQAKGIVVERLHLHKQPQSWKAERRSHDLIPLVAVQEKHSLLIFTPLCQVGKFPSTARYQI